MTYKSAYVKEIEEYFLSHAGKGVMLSPKDYDLILSWKKKKIPKELVLKGISNAFDRNVMWKNHGRFLPSLYRIVSFIEEAIECYRPLSSVETRCEQNPDKALVDELLERMNQIIKSEKREKIRRIYLQCRRRLLTLIAKDDKNAFKSAERIEEYFFETFFESLAKTEGDQIIFEAERRSNKNSRFMTERARHESLISFRNEILKKKYGLKSIFSDD